MMRLSSVYRAFVMLMALVMVGAASGRAFSVQAAEATVTHTYASVKPGPAIPDHGCTDNASVTSAITVPDSFLLGAVRVGINLTHSWRGDVFVRLTSPDGASINILNVGDANANFNVLIDDSATAASGAGPGAVTHDVNAASWPYTWRSAAGLSIFKGARTAGTWTLTVCDRYWGDKGQLNFWNLYLDDDRSDYSGTVINAAPSGAVIPGNTVTYSIVVPNNSGRDGVVSISAPLPAEVAYVAGSARTSPATGNLVATNNQLTWNGSILASQSVTLTYQALVTAQNGWITTTATVSDALSLAPVVRRLAVPVAAPLYHTSRIATTPAAGALASAGQVIVYSVNITNSGLLPGNATLLNPIPAGVTYVAGSVQASAGAVPVFDGAAITWSGNVAAGGRTTISYQARVNALADLAPLSNLITNTATINDRLAVMPALITSVNRVNAPYYGLSTIKAMRASDGLAGSTGIMIPGQPVTVVIGLYNSGTAAGAVTVNAPVAANAQAQPGSGSASSGSLPTVNTAGLTWSGALAVGQRVTLTYRLIGSALSGDYTHAVSINDSQVGAPVQKTFSMPIATPMFELTTFMPGKAAVATGEHFTYTLIVRNSGRAAATASSAVIVLPAGLLPDGFALATAGAAQWAVSPAGATQLEWNGSIPAGGSVSIAIPVMASTLCGTQIALSVALSDRSVAPAITTIAALGVQAYYNVVLNEDFNSVAVAPPTGWTINRPSGNCDFMFANWYNHTGGVGGYFYASSFTCGKTATMDTELRSPVFNLVNATAPVLQFRYDYYRGLAWGQVAAVDISTAGSAGPWVNVWKLTTDDRGPKLARVDLKAYTGKSNLMLRWHYAAPYWAYWWQVDDVLLYQVCPVSIGPEALREGSACRGKTITYTLTVANMGAVADSVKMTYTASANGAWAGWRTTIQPATVQLNAGASVSVNVVIAVPWVSGATPSGGDMVVTAQGTASGQAGQVILRTSAAGCGGWSALANVPVPAADAALTYYGGALYQIGGSADGAYMPTKAVYRYNISANTWQTATMMPVAVAGTDAVAVGDTIYVPGGEINAGNSSQTTLVQAYHPLTNGWDTVAPLPIPLSYYEAHALNGRIYVIGGYSYGAVTNTLLIYDPATNTWTRGAPMAQARMFAAAGVIGGKLYVAGGYNGKQGLNTLEIYTPGVTSDPGVIPAGSWSEGPALLQPKDSGASGVLGDRYLVVAGGWQSKLVTRAVIAFDVQTNVWVELPALSSFRVGARADGDGTRLYVVGGYDILNGASTTSKRNEVMAVCPACAAADKPQGQLAMAVAPTSLRHGQPMTFTVSLADSSPLNFTWDYGDGVRQDNGDRVSTHTYAAGGTYHVVVTASNACGSISVATTVQVAQYGVTLNPPVLSNQVETDPKMALQSNGNLPAIASAVTYTLRVTNTGTLADRILLGVGSSNGWGVSVSPQSTANLAPGQGANVVVVVQLPDGFLSGTNATTLTATSAGDPQATDTSTLTTYLNVYRTYVPVVMQ